MEQWRKPVVPDRREQNVGSIILGYKMNDSSGVSKHFSNHRMNMDFTSEYLQNPIIYENNLILKTLSAL